MLRRPHLLSLLLLVADFAFSPSVMAQEKDEDECLRLYPDIRSPVEFARCTSDLEGSERALDRVYLTLVRRVARETVPDLERAQKAWLTFRDATCKYNAGGSGTGHSSAVVGCIADMNRARARELESDLERWTD